MNDRGCWIKGRGCSPGSILSPASGAYRRLRGKIRIAITADADARRRLRVCLVGIVAGSLLPVRRLLIDRRIRCRRRVLPAPVTDGHEKDDYPGNHDHPYDDRNDHLVGVVLHEIRGEAGCDGEDDKQYLDERPQSTEAAVVCRWSIPLQRPTYSFSPHFSQVITFWTTGFWMMLPHLAHK